MLSVAYWSCCNMCYMITHMIRLVVLDAYMNNIKCPSPRHTHPHTSAHTHQRHTHKHTDFNDDFLIYIASISNTITQFGGFIV